MVPLHLTISVLLSLSTFAGADPDLQCKTHTLTKSSLIKGPVYIDTSPTLPFQHSALNTLNSTAQEYWYVDAASSTAKSGVKISFYRDPSLRHLGISPFRVSVDGVWDDGKKFDSLLEADTSSIVMCSNGYTKGEWIGPQLVSRFEFEGENRQVKVYVDGTSIQGAKVKGTFSLTSFSQARYPTGETYPNPAASVAFAPLIHWNEGIPASNVYTSFDLGGKRLSFRGTGGTERNMLGYNWDNLSRKWWWVRAVAGPYTLVHWKFISALNNRTYSYAYLEERQAGAEGTPIFRSMNMCTTDDDSNCAIFELKQVGVVRGQFNDTNTGFAIEYRGETKKWHFNIDHVHVMFESPGSNDEYSRFVNSVKGGQEEKKVWNGESINEQNRIRIIPPIL